MRRNWIVCLSVVSACWNASAFAEPVLLISIDGLHPRYVIEADQLGLEIPNLRSFVREGAYADGVVGVVPTITYPSHTTILTGVAPEQHGITSNTTFDPLAKNQDGWFWYAEDIKVPSLWTAAAAAGLTTASVNWPVTVGEKYIQFLLPEYWRTSTADDLKALRALSRPDGALERMERDLGPFVDGYADTVESDRIRTRFTVAILREQRPDFMATHLIALDGVEHRDGPFVASVYETLEAIDDMLGELSAAAVSNDPSAIVVIVSDHGFIATHTAVNLRSTFVDAGLIDLAEPLSQYAAPTILSWDAQIWPGAAVAAIVLRNREDHDVQARVAMLLAKLEADSSNGIARVLSVAELAASGGFPQADFLVEFAPGFYLGSALRGDLLTRATSKGTHGYMPDRPEMHAAFFIKGRRIAAARDLGVIDMRQIAPTLAALLGVELGNAREPALLISALPPRTH